MHESIWDRRKDAVLRTGGVLVVLLLIAGNIWVGDKLLRGGAYGVTIHPWDLHAFFGENNTKQIWKEPKNILVLGRAGKGNNAPYLTDTIVVIHAQPQENTVKLISLPRDLLVHTDDSKKLKLNALWLYSGGERKDDFSEITQAVESITGLTIDNTVIFDLETLYQVIDEIDGVVVYVPTDIHDPRFPAPEGGYETFSLKSGWRHLNAEDALRFVRTRHSPLGDFDRIAHQQELVRSVKGKVVSLNPVWDFGTLWNIYGTIQNNVITDLTPEDAWAFWEFSKTLSLEEVDSFVLSTETNLIRPYTVATTAGVAYALVATEEDPYNYGHIRQHIATFITE